MTQAPTASPAFRPIYSPEFISADDAAVYVSLQIGDLRDREYGGLIFKRGDRFIATAPLPGSATSFDATRVFPSAGGHPQRVPEGLKLVGLYHSHPDLLDAPLNTNFFSTSDIYAAITYKQSFGCFYLSNPDGSLLKYSAGDTQEASALLALVAPPTDDPAAPSLLQHELNEGRYSREAFVRSVAESGHLQVVLGSDLWEAGNKVSPRWQAGAPHSDLIPPQHLGPCFRTQEDAMRWLTGYAPWSAEHTLSVGLILRNDLNETYAPLYATPLHDAGFAPDSLLPANALGVGELPIGHSISAFYFASLANRTEGGLLTLNGDNRFISTQLMFAVLSKLSQNRALTAYVVTKEAAILKYTAGDSETRQALLADLMPFGGPRSPLHQALANGTMSETQFIQRVAAAGELSVVHADGSWPSRGIITANWTPSTRKLDKPLIWRLGPLFTASDDAVDAAINPANAMIGIVLRHAQLRAYATGLLTSGPTLNYSLSGVVDIQVSRRLPLPEGYVFDGLYFYPGATGDHSYPQADEIFHPEALTYFFMLIAQGFELTHAYWATPYGALIKYSSRGSREEDALISQLSAPASGQPGRLLAALTSGRATIEQLIGLLARSGELTVLRVGGIWQQRGVLAPDSNVS
ncbi:DUF4329 domain-containing protein [Pseudomonas yamanorum]